MSDGIPENSTTKIHNRVGFKVGLGIPIGVGLGGFLFSLIVLTLFLDSGYNFEVVALFALTLHISHLILWPSLSIWFIFRAKNLDNLPLRNGALLSMKLYVVWIVLFVFPFAWFAYNFNGIV